MSGVNVIRDMRPLRRKKVKANAQSNLSSKSRVKEAMPTGTGTHEEILKTWSYPTSTVI
jgi:hypothetical protein